MTIHSRRFEVQRDIDHTGVSGTGTVADGVQWPDGTISMKWRGIYSSAVSWDNAEVPAMEKVEHVHGHDGATRIVFLDSTEDSEMIGNRLGTNSGHGHVWSRPDGRVMRCGGPALCSECARDAQQQSIKDSE